MSFGLTGIFIREESTGTKADFPTATSFAAMIDGSRIELLV